MGELKPCPFCGGEAFPGTVTYSDVTVREQEWEQNTFHKVNCSTCGANNLSVVGFRTPEEAATAWNTRPRTEGRGEEPVAWRYRWNDRRYEDSWDYITNKQRSTFKHLQGDAAVQWEIQPLYASPIREPEISRTALIAALDAKLAEVGGAFLSNDQAADAILNLAPVATGAGAEPGAGWVYNSPDTGMEYSTEHPLESGEIPDATDVRRSTFFEDWMFGEIGRLDAKVRELVVNLAPVGEGSSRSQDPRND